MEGWQSPAYCAALEMRLALKSRGERSPHLPPNIGDLREPGLNELIANESIPLKGSAGPNPAISANFV